MKFQLLDIVDRKGRGGNFYLFGKTIEGFATCVEVEGFRNYILIKKPMDVSLGSFKRRLRGVFMEIKMRSARRVRSMGIRAFLEDQKWPGSYKFNILHVYLAGRGEYSQEEAKEEFVAAELSKLEDEIEDLITITTLIGRDICDVSADSIVQDTRELYYKISLKRTYDFYALKKTLRSHDFYGDFYSSKPMLYNCNVSRHQRWMLDYQIKPCFWLTLKDSKPMCVSSQKLLSENVKHTRLVRCDNVSCVEDDVVSRLVILCLDIETEPFENNKKERQENPETRPDVTFRGIGEDNILQVSLVWTSTADMSIICTKLIYIAGNTEKEDEIGTSYDEVDFKPSNAILVPCRTEKELLNKLREAVLQIDPDIITGYNVTAFDMNVIWKRCKKFDVKTTWSRFKDYECPMKITKTSSRAHGASENYKFTIGGRTLMDLYDLVKKEHNLISYKLDVVAETFLGTKKLDCKYEDIPKLQETSAGRMRMGAYCLKDSWLVIRLLAKLSKLSNVIEMSRVTGISMRDVLDRGQMIRSLCSIYQYAKKHDPEYFLPDIVNKSKFTVTRCNTISTGGGLKIKETTQEAPRVGYKGAVVFPPTPGYYNDPVCCLDFASLYPSIMRYRNMCYSTLVSKSTIEKLKLVEDLDYHRIADVDIVGDGELKVYQNENDTCFLTHERRPGILPEILETLLLARKRAKKDMKMAKDKNAYNVCNGRQLALKLVCNSMYGFTGTSYGFLPCLPIASAVTSTGRFLALSTKAIVEQNYIGCKCVYGDTDSVFVKIPKTILKAKDTMGIVREAAALSEKMAALCDQSYHLNQKGHIVLEFEKVLWPLVLLKKKRYYSYKYEEGKLDKPAIDYKGIECKRRDGSKITKTWQKKILHMVLIEQDVQKVKDFISQGLHDLYNDNVPLDEFIMSQKLSRHPSSYKVPGAHVKLAVKQMKVPSCNVRVGDRIPYCIRAGYKGEKSSDRAVAPADIASGKYKIDLEHYVEKCIRKPLVSMLRFVIPDIETYFNIYVRKNSSASAMKRLFPGAVCSRNPHRKKRRRSVASRNIILQGHLLQDFFKTI